MSTFIAERTPVTTLPGEPVPYVIEAGSGRAHVLLGEVGRALVGAEESNGAMSVMALDGPRADRPIPLHYHDREYEFFYCLRGAIQLWADDESRVLAPGDFGYIPPGTLHAYQLRGHHSTFVGPVVPGGWDRFFDLTGEPFGTAAFPQGPKGPPPFEKFGQRRGRVQDEVPARRAVRRGTRRRRRRHAARRAAGVLPARRRRPAPRARRPAADAPARRRPDEGRVDDDHGRAAQGPRPAGARPRAHLRVADGDRGAPARDARRRGARAHPRRHGEHPGRHRARLPRRGPLHEGAHDERAGRARAADRDGGDATGEHVFGAAGELDLDALREAAAELDVTFA